MEPSGYLIVLICENYVLYTDITRKPCLHFKNHSSTRDFYLNPNFWPIAKLYQPYGLEQNLSWVPVWSNLLNLAEDTWLRY